jgi:hypothetical protein
VTLEDFLAPSQGGLTSDQAAQAAERTTYDAAQRRQELAAADARVDEAEQDVELPPAAFEPPPCPGCRTIDADEARRLLGGR